MFRSLGCEPLEERQLLTSAAIVAENALPGTSPDVWDVGTGSTNIEGYATSMSVNHGQTIQFKINTNSDDYRIDIYRLGYYGGLGARYITTVNPNVSLPQNQPNPIENASTGLVDAGNWKVSAQWAVPANATSGIYIADLIRQDGTDGMNQIIFVVRNDEGQSDMVFKTSDSTWEAYNDWGGNNLYGGDGIDGSSNGRAYAVSYNRPFATRADKSDSFFFSDEYPMVRFLERNGYDVSYVATTDLDERGSLLLNHKVFLSVGHDEYWSAAERSAVETARDAGVNLAFFSGNEMFWKTYLTSSSFDPTTADRTLVTYKETHANAIIDPVNPNIWTGTWRDPRFSPPTDGGRPENAVTGTLFMVNDDGSPGYAITVPGSDASLRFWRNTSIANLSPNQTATLSDYVLGYEWDADVDNGFRPAGLIDMSSTTRNTSQMLQDYGSKFGSGTVTHSLTLYRAASGALVFSAGTVQWAWGLDGTHDGASASVDSRMQQATVNLFADMGAQPTSLMAGLVPATMSTDHIAPTSTITSPLQGAFVQAGVPITITGTAQDAGGGVVAGVEVSVDGGLTWHPATGRASWSYSWTARTSGTVTFKSRAVDDSGNIEQPSAGITVNPPVQGTTTFTLWNNATTPSVVDSGDGQAVELGVKFISDTNGTITGLRFYKSAANTGTHTASLWTAGGQLLATASFTNETASGWQQVNFATPVAITAGTTYVASYHTNAGHYSSTQNYFTTLGVDSGPLHALANGVGGGNGVYRYGTGGFPSSTFQSSNYWVDVVLNTAPLNDTSPPTVTAFSPANGTSNVATNATVSISFSEALSASSVNTSTIQLRNAATGTVIPSTVSYTAGGTVVTLTPTSALANSTAYTIFVQSGTSGVKDVAGNALASNATSSFTTSASSAPPSTSSSSLWPASTTPAIVDSGDTQGVELGVKFTADSNGTITGLRFYKSAANTGTHTASLWTASGQLLATATFTNETASGWQQVNFATPVAITAGTTYVASYHTNTGHYSVNRSYFTSQFNSGSLHVPANGGVYLYGTGGFPVNTYQSSNYWVDVVLNATITTPPADTTPPTVTAFSPANGTTNVATNATVTVTFSEALSASTVNTTTIQLRNSATSAVIPSTVSYTAGGTVVTLTPTSALANSTAYTIFVQSGASGVKDVAGNALASNATASFTTAAAVDTTPPTVTGFTPSGSSVAVNTTVTVAFSEALSASTVNTNTIQLRNSATSAVIPSAISYTAGGTVVTLTPTSALANSTAYTIFVQSGASGVKDVAGNPLANNATSSFTTAAPVDTTPPTVTAFSPADGTANVATNATANVTFSEGLNAATVTASTVFLRDASNVVVPASVAYNTSTNTVTVTPSIALDNLTTYTVVVKSGAAGVKDLAGNALAADATASFTTVGPSASPSSSSSSLWTGSATPAIVDSADGQGVELGVKFTADTSGSITGLRFYKSAANTGTHTASLWTASGQLLATATFANETASGWQQVNFAAPVAITAGTTYVASYHTNAGHYSVSRSYFTSQFNSGLLHVPANGGVYRYGTSGFPSSTYQSSNYWVDVVLNATTTPPPPPPADTTPPTVTAFSPANSTTNVATNAIASITFSEALNATTVNANSIFLRNANNVVVSASVAYNTTTNTVTLTPTSPLANSTTYTVVVKGGSAGVKDLAGNALAADATISFTTAAPVSSSH